jgi:chitodextrinase/C1A family cysteine protease
MKKTFTTVVLILALCVTTFAQRGLRNPAAVYCQFMGYGYSVQRDGLGNEVGMCTLPTGQKVNAWDFYKGKVAQEYSYAAKKGYELQSVTETIDGYTVEKAVCTREVKGVQERLTLEELMELNGDKLQLESKGVYQNVYETAKENAGFVYAKTTPTSFDWRSYNGHTYIGAVRDQGSCGSCYAFGATACAEGTYNYATGSYDSNTSDFAESYIVWCLGAMSAYSSNFGGCGGADYTYSELQALCDIGTIPESYFPYTESTGQSCPSAATNATKTKFSSWYRVTCSDIDAIKTAIMTYGVVDAAVYVSTSFQNYTGGIFTDSYTTCSTSPCYNTPTNHAIALVGWGTDATTGDYWILRNSWGSSWGESGYMRIDATSARVACEVCYMIYTPATVTVPTVTTTAVSSISTTTAVGGGNVTANGGGTVTASGIVYSTTTTPTLTSGTVLSTSPVTTSGSYTLSMSGLTAGTTYYVRAYATNSAGTAYGSQVSFTTSTTADTQAPTAPTNLASSSVTSTTATLTWTASTDNVAVTGYSVYQNGTLLGTTTSTSYSVTGLTASTAYTFYVTAKDAAGNVSSASSTITVTTSAATITYCTSKGTNYSYEWIDLVQLNTINNVTTANAGYGDFTSLSTTLTTGTSYTVYFSAGFASSSYTEYWYIWIDYDHDGTFESTELINSTSSTLATTLSKTFTVPTTATVGSTRMRVTMKYNSAPTACETFSYGEVEDYTVIIAAGVADTQAPTAPTSLAASSVTATTATLSWTASTDNVAVTGYNVYKNSTLLGTTTSASYSVTGLTAATTYSFYVTAYDAAGNVSAASSSLSVTTSTASITYCTSKGSNVTYEWIDLVKLNTINNVTTANAGYGDFTSLSTSLALGTSYTVYFSAGFKSTAYTEYWYIWIDYDHDGSFESAELINSGSSKLATTLSKTFTVPTTATVGSTRMRVTMKYNSAPTSCETFSYGEVEDYTIVITGTSSSIDRGDIIDAEEIGNEPPSSISVYPNPSKNLINVKANGIEFTNNTVKIFNSKGALVKVTTIDKPIDVSKLPAGVYIITVDDPKEPFSTRFVKQ